MKRTADILSAACGLLLLFPLFAVVALMIKVDSRGPVFFRQERVGRGFRPFRIYKFRTMVEKAAEQGSLLTAGGDPRITRVGRILRQTKVDELPQLINVLKGDMSVVGPRPEVRRYVDVFHYQYETILAVRPGITDLASLKYRDESAMLAASPHPEQTYIEEILPDKLRLAELYVQQASSVLDIVIIIRTFMALIGDRFSQRRALPTQHRLNEGGGHPVYPPASDGFTEHSHRRES
jgi:lipopolysaccharide/colanic/teichoic acid biosynthesis glycosyltransferase